MNSNLELACIVSVTDPQEKTSDKTCLIGSHCYEQSRFCITFSATLMHMVFSSNTVDKDALDNIH